MKLKNLKMEQVAFANFAYTKYSLKYTLDSLQKIGAHAIEFYCADPHFCLEDCTLEDMKVVKKMLDERDLHVVNVCPENCTYPMNLASKNIATRARTFKNYVNAIHTASEWGCPHVLIFPGFALFDESYEDAWTYGIDAMTSLAQIAEENGVQIILEAASRASTVLVGIDNSLRMIKELNSPAVTGMLDLMCIAICKDDIRESINKLGIDQIRHIHFSDAKQLAPGQWEHRVVGDGELDIEDDLVALDQAGYKDYFGCEVFAPYKQEPEKAMLRYKSWCEERFQQ